MLKEAQDEKCWQIFVDGIGYVLGWERGHYQTNRDAANYTLSNLSLTSQPGKSRSSYRSVQSAATSPDPGCGTTDMNHNLMRLDRPGHDNTRPGGTAKAATAAAKLNIVVAVTGVDILVVDAVAAPTADTVAVAEPLQLVVDAVGTAAAETVAEFFQLVVHAAGAAAPHAVTELLQLVADAVGTAAAETISELFQLVFDAAGAAAADTVAIAGLLQLVVDAVGATAPDAVVKFLHLVVDDACAAAAETVAELIQLVFDAAVLLLLLLLCLSIYCSLVLSVTPLTLDYHHYV
ncbi:hypothetical protein PoB_004645700 [Plakobranchus ocellatus]|uniref:Uncharacterized protein n=1 Tax=Plakobranchus ocellatus TaxID=259542 RepID=A0AAV4BLZ8_9GAST|nr:hypothetical protein PoB_004645700 [Plakobranchus ocellatus]